MSIFTCVCVCVLLKCKGIIIPVLISQRTHGEVTVHFQAFSTLLLYVGTRNSLIMCIQEDKSRGTAVVQWLRCRATNRKVASSIPAGVS